MRLSFYLMFSFLLLCLSCKKTSTSGTDGVKDKTAAIPQTNETTNKEATLAPYPSITDEIMMNLWDNAEYLDIIFYDLPISMNLDTPGGVKKTLTHIEKKPAKMHPDCKPTGKVSFIADGELLIEAEFYVQQECRCYIFLENGQPKYCNRISDVGMAYYQNAIMAAINSINQGQLQGQQQQ